MALGTIIKKARKQCGLTQVALATKASMAQSIVSAIEGGTRNPTLRTMKRLAKALGLRLVVRLENENGSGYEWSTGIVTAQNLAGSAGTLLSAPDETPSSEQPNPNIG